MPNKLLVVDDEPDLELLIKQKFRKEIKNNEYDFVFAQNGFEALDKLVEYSDIDLVLTDINMPGMDGLTLLDKIGESYQFIKSIIISAYDDMKNIRMAMNKGAIDFITKPIDFNDLQITITKSLELVKKLKDNERLQLEKIQAQEKAFKIQKEYAGKLKNEVDKQTQTLQKQKKEIITAYDELKNAKEQLVRAEKLASLGILAAGLSHEINNPNNYILNCSTFGIENVQKIEEGLAQFNEVEEFKIVLHPVFEEIDSLKELLPSIKKGSRRINDIMQGLSRFAHLHNNEKSDANINKLLKLSSSSLNFMIKNKIEIIMTLSELPLVKCDEGAIEQSFTHLLRNAIQSISHANGVIEISTEHKDKDVLIFIKDNGIGIPKEILPKIFDPFFTTKNIGEGLGLGLSMCHSIIEGHGGSLNIESIQGEGSKVIISLPAIV